MRVLLINGSPKKHICYGFCKAVESAAKEYDYDVDIVDLYDYNIAFCRGCKNCESTGICSIDDKFNLDIEPKIKEAELIVFATPNYFSLPSAAMKNFMDRSYVLYDYLQSHKKEYAVFVSADNDYYGSMSVYEAISNYANAMGMEEKVDPYMQMNVSKDFVPDEKMNDYIQELLMKKIYVDVDTPDDDEAITEIDE